MAREADAAVPEAGATTGGVGSSPRSTAAVEAAVAVEAAAAVGACASTTWATAAAEGPWWSS